MRFDIKPRYYDPIKEEIEERTSRIKYELEQEGLLNKSENEGDGIEKRKGLGSGIRGSFAQRGMKPKSTSMISASSVIRTLLFFGMVIGVFGYIYLGPEIFNYMLYAVAVIGGGYYLFRFLKRSKDE
ncbi:hypothetical protein D0X99_07910 [Algoriphagus lacus]|uniref:Uncharacterized protein n=2 Tax=Algoriphagus lacus TaxID=2056311 RepID=A0A418PT65_9BACT|nr:hypothetical protein D0X99_07910 [Algoriphagus lacus]